jgi:diguanylate cyclase (GGDEF)-like protein
VTDENLVDELQRLRALVGAIPDPIYRLTADGVFVSVEVPDDHPQAMAQDMIPGRSLRNEMPRRQADAVMQAIGTALETGQLCTVEYDLVVGGEQRWWEARIVPVGDEVLAMVREVTERRRSEAEALRAARTDTVTGLANRAAFADELEHALARSLRSGRALAVLFCDLDRFKAVNDQFGHAAGDVVLAEAAARVRGVLRDVDLAARIGGDELAILVEDVDFDDGLETLGLRLVDAVSQPYSHETGVHRIGLSVGVAIFPDDASSAEELIGVADTAMYRAKARGGSQIAYGR